MNTNYDDLSSEQIRVMAVKDAEHSGDMAEQARVLRDMAGDLRDAVDKVRGHSEGLFGKGILTSKEAPAPDSHWSGHSAGMMTVELRRLYGTFSDAPDKLKSNGDTLDKLTTKVQDTNIALDKLTTGSGSTSTKDTEARRIMSDAATTYLDTANGLAEPQFYKGMRKKDPADAGGDDWTHQYGTPRSTPSTPLEPRTPSHPGTATNPSPTSPSHPGTPVSDPIPASDPTPTSDPIPT
ncbi:MAG TPA: hypothetical protein VE172_04085, partial [Stackebrandtia sp.]|nr:hypothetical protein [Stackebrandtia sp.]